MIAIDWVLLGVVGVSALFGLMRGMIGVLASLAAWILGGWAAFQFGAQVALMLASDGEPSAGQLFAGYALAFIVVMVAVGVLGWVVRKLVHSVGLSGLDRIFGLALGAVRGIVIACAMLLLLGLTELPREASWQSSRVVPLLVPGAEQMRAFLPDWVAAQVDLDGHSGGTPLLSSGYLPMLSRQEVVPRSTGSAIIEDAATSVTPGLESPLPAPVRAPHVAGEPSPSVMPAAGD